MVTVVDKVYLYNDNIGYVELVDSTEASLDEQSRIKIASISHGKDSARKPEHLYNKLKKLGHNSVFEFVRLPRFWRGRIMGYRVEESLRHNPNLGYITSDDDIEAHHRTLAMFKVKVPIFVARQVMRHRRASYLEMSRRYTKGKLEFYIYPKLRDKTHKFYTYVEDLYNFLVKERIPAEIARSILPVSLYTTFYIMMDYKSFKNFIVERLSVFAQDETMILAAAMVGLLAKHRRSFIGLYFKDVKTGEVVNIIDVISSGEERILDYGDPTHYVIIRDKLFREKILKEEVE